MIKYSYNGREYDIIPLSEMKVDVVYEGFCRNASYALWNGERFIHLRTKWTATFLEDISHPENEEHYDVFMVQKVAEECDDVTLLLERIEKRNNGR